MGFSPVGGVSHSDLARKTQNALGSVIPILNEMKEFSESAVVTSQEYAEIDVMKQFKYPCDPVMLTTVLITHGGGLVFFFHTHFTTY
ncbi:unnamed protein product [Arctogadus glacialis]